MKIPELISDYPNFESIGDYCKGLKDNYPKLSDYELLKIAVQMQRNDILRAGLNVSQSDTHPSALEAIAMQLGMKSKGVIRTEIGTILYELENIANQLSTIASNTEQEV